MASLSLALGLADVVQNHAGGLRLESLFIDEGFGSLDAEALDQALQVLMELRQAGRLIGVISHVSELKERINTRIEVVPQARGSITRIIGGSPVHVC
jgi:exonuclease SbcC